MHFMGLEVSGVRCEFNVETLQECEVDVVRFAIFDLKRLSSIIFVIK